MKCLTTFVSPSIPFGSFLMTLISLDKALMKWSSSNTSENLLDQYKMRNIKKKHVKQVQEMLRKERKNVNMGLT